MSQRVIDSARRKSIFFAINIYIYIYIYLALTPRGANKLKDLTEQHTKQLVITFLDQKPIQVAVIFEPVTSGVLALCGEFSREEAVEYTRRINSLKMRQR